MNRDRAIFALTLLVAVGVFLVDVFADHEVLLPAAPYAVPIGMAAYLLPVPMVAAVSVFTVALQLAAAWVQQSPATWVIGLYLLSTAVIGLMGTSLAARMMHESVLAQEREKAVDTLRVLIDNLPAGVVVSDINGNTTLFNPAANAMLGDWAVGTRHSPESRPCFEGLMDLPSGSMNCLCIRSPERKRMLRQLRFWSIGMMARSRCSW